MLVILSIDPSMRKTGVCVLVNGEVEHLGLIKVCSKIKGVDVLVEIYTALNELLSRYNPDVVAIEGYSFGSHGRVFQLGEVGGVLRLALANAGVPAMLVIPPTRVKKFTGSGKASKLDIIRYVQDTEDIECTSNDMADALVIGRIAEAVLRYKDTGELPPTRKAAEVVLGASKTLITTETK